MFYKSSASKDGYQWYCKDCARESHKPKDARKPINDTVTAKQVASDAVKQGIVPSSAKKIWHLEALAPISNRDLIEELRARGFTGKLEYTYKIEF